MPLQKIVIPTMKELFIRQMEDLILSGELAIGEQLPNERELAAQMNVSRTIVNSGIQELAKNGFVHIIPRKGTFVNDYMQNGNLGTLTTITNYNNGRFDPRILESLMEYRIINEGKCAFLAAQRRTEKDLETLYRIQEEMESCDDQSQRTALSIQLHRSIFIATQNVIYPLVFNTFGEAIETLTQLLFRYIDGDIACKAMRSILDAIREQDAVLAQSLTVEYGNKCREIISMQYSRNTLGT